MKSHARLYASLFSCVVLAQWAAPAQASAGCLVQGNALNPSGVNPSTVGNWMDEEGLGTRIPAARAPSGQFYNIPLSPREEAEAAAKGEAGWKGWGYAELGGLAVSGDERSQGFRNYKDLKSGAYLNSFAVTGEDKANARYVEAIGGGVGMLDQFYCLQFGRYNDWKVSAFYDSLPQVFTTTYRSLWSGAGTGNLTLNGLTPGGSASAATTQTNIRNALATTENSELEVVRKTAGVRFDMNLTDAWKIYASFVNEKRQGARPFGAVFGGGGGGGNMEVAESIDYDTHNFAAGLQFSDSVSSFNFSATASFFRNDIDAMTFQNPLYITLNGITGLNPGSFTQGRIDLAPDNEHYNIKGEYARAFPNFYKGKLTATVALGTMRQNDKLVTPTEYSLSGGTVTAGGRSLANVWNTPGALSRDSADARIDTLLADLGLVLKPVSGLDVNGKLRYYETRNSMQYQSCNPLTGQWGRLLNDGSGLSLVTANTTAGVNPAGTSANAYNAVGCNLDAARALNLSPASGNVPIASVPFDYQQFNASLSGDYRLGKASSLNATLERETFNREFRERDETWEDRFKLGFVDRGTIDGMIRLSYEFARRRGGEYDPNPYEAFYSASLGPVPSANAVAMPSWLHSINQFRAFDLADRNQNVLNARVNYAFHEVLEGAVTLQAKDAEFPGQLGRTGHQKSNSATVDMSYQAGSTAVVYGYYTYQRSAMEQAGVQPNSCTLNNTYYFYSNGQVLMTVRGAPAPVVPAGLTLVSTQNVTAANWSSLCGAASPTSPLFPDSRGWDVASKDRNHVIGAGVKYDFGKVRLDTNFTRTLGRTQINYTYNGAALDMTPVQAALAGGGPSDLSFAQNIFDASVLVPINKNLTMRFLVRYETGKTRDWHYDGVATNPMPANNALYLDAGPQDYRATVVGVLFQVAL
ncbi:MtrB/PioB family outer membrane beta-barrel protein [Usitatibacter palustris]|uniref:MtrB/PioB family decaheme-associated outer membrane protein n=1 Tax=Usitatibacter palustris TaxID=2732487 RepID=A0A6M4H4T4_9PROT|nr:MtrB/PioB family outer membrane beta-barrel protein [Usitatibacter palustris]QJR13958.1 hypothetical protein DSM104440_00750 [Usitatibacter palustris]